MVEHFLRDLTQNQLKMHSLSASGGTKYRHIDTHNHPLKPFISNALARDILEKATRARQAPDGD
jgi:hypothetical protein